MKKLQITYIEVPCEVDKCRAFVYRIPRNNVTDKIMNSEAVPFRNVTNTTYDIPGTSEFLRKWNRKRIEIDPESEINVNCCLDYRNKL